MLTLDKKSEIIHAVMGGQKCDVVAAGGIPASTCSRIFQGKDDIMHAILSGNRTKSG